MFKIRKTLTILAQCKQEKVDGAPMSSEGFVTFVKL